MRNRSRNGSLTYSSWTYQTFTTRSGCYIKNNLGETFTYPSETFSDVVDNKNGENACDHYKYVITNKPGTYKVSANGNRTYIGNGCDGNPVAYTQYRNHTDRMLFTYQMPAPVPSVDTTGMYADAIRLIKSDFNLSAQLLEIQQLPGLLSSKLLNIEAFPRKKTFKPTAREIKEFKKRARKKHLSRSSIGRFVQNAGSDYLNVSFGWIPTVGAVNQLVDGISQFARISEEIEKQRNTKSYYSVCSSSRSGRNTLVDTTSGTYLSLNRVTTVRKELKIKYRFTVEDLELNIPLLHARLLSDSINLLKIASGVWEAAPWSWFSDYFINIGSMIASSEEQLVRKARPRLEVKSSIMGTTTEQKWTVQTNWWSGVNQRPEPGETPPRVDHSKTTYKREIISDLSVYDGALTKLSSGSGLNSRKLSYLMAIAGQKI